MLERLEDDAVEKPKLREPTLTFTFPECSRLAPPVLPFDEVAFSCSSMPPVHVCTHACVPSRAWHVHCTHAQVSFSYSGEAADFLYEKIDIGVDCDSRIALVGPNGCGKSTLLKLMSGERSPTEGSNMHPVHVRACASSHVYGMCMVHVQASSARPRGRSSATSTARSASTTSTRATYSSLTSRRSAS